MWTQKIKLNDSKKFSILKKGIGIESDGNKLEMMELKVRKKINSKVFAIPILAVIYQLL